MQSFFHRQNIMIIHDVFPEKQKNLDTKFANSNSDITFALRF